MNPPPGPKASDLTLVTRTALSVLDDVGVRYRIIEADPGTTVLAFDHLALDELQRKLDKACTLGHCKAAGITS